MKEVDLRDRSREFREATEGSLTGLLAPFGVSVLRVKKKKKKKLVSLISI